MPKSCAKCQGSMTQGFTLADRDGSRKVSRWVEGSPAAKWWGIQIRGKRQIDVQTWRCGRCGFLESYAVE